MTPDFDKLARAVFDPLNTQLKGFEYTQAVGDIIRLQIEAWNAALEEAAKMLDEAYGHAAAIDNDSPHMQMREVHKAEGMAVCARNMREAVRSKKLTVRT